MVWVVPVLHHINPWLLCLVVAIILLLESCGIPILNSSLLLFAGAVASLGHVNIIVLALAAIIGSTSGACLAYLIGLRGGELALNRLLTRLHVNTRRIEQARGWFANAGGRMILLSRILPYVRPFACFFGGIAQMPFRRFLAAALSGSILWCVAALSVGWMLGRRWRIALYLIQSYTLPTLGVLVLAIAVYILAKVLINRRRSRKRQQAD
ncbi:MAG TPA: DedA family protein, partial [Ktedonobacteraceae bacterium]|nr:DedA family protein [Ktedonobacteraceae bacterium]